MSAQLFASITYDERMNFFKSWNERHGPMGFLAYDVTSFSTNAKGEINREYGYNRDEETTKQINLGCFVSEFTDLPVFYVTYPGSIVDKSHLPYLMAYGAEAEMRGV
jgi:transposase